MLARSCTQHDAAHDRGRRLHRVPRTRRVCPGKTRRKPRQWLHARRRTGHGGGGMHKVAARRAARTAGSSGGRRRRGRGTRARARSHAGALLPQLLNQLE
jgi:hypothetical protein